VPSETEELTLPDGLPSRYRLYLEVLDDTAAEDPSRGFFAELVWFDSRSRTWIKGGGFGVSAFAPGNPRRVYDGLSTQVREERDGETLRRYDLDVMHGKAAKVLVTFRGAPFDVAIRVEAETSTDGEKAELRTINGQQRAVELRTGSEERLRTALRG
jgi:hypothetical protein